MSNKETTTKGMTVFKFASIFLSPNFRTGVFVKKIEDERSVTKYLEKIKNFMKKEEMEWSWVLFLRQGEFPRTLKNFVKKDRNPKMGIGLLNLNNMDLATNTEFLGKQMKKYFLVKK